MKKAFTLIELLVVISIIALLASVVIASLNSARDKSRIGAGRYFEAQVGHVAGDELVGVWNFDECSGGPKDGSGAINTGTFQGSPTYFPDTPTGTGCSLYFDGVNAAMRIPNAPTTFQTIHGPSTLSLWFKPTTLVGTYNRIFSDNCFEWGIFTNGSTVYGAAYNSISGGNISTGKWYQATLVHEHPSGLTGTLIKFYIDGVLKGSTTWTFGGGENGYNNDSPYWVGGDGCTAGSYFNGYVDNVRIYSKALTASEIGKEYASEAPKFRLADDIQ